MIALVVALPGCASGVLDLGAPADPAPWGSTSRDGPEGSAVDGGGGATAAGSTGTGTGSGRRCNGRADLCDRPYDLAVTPCTHNAYSTAEDGFLLPTPNQTYAMARQLDDGVRCLMLDTWDLLGTPYLCHGACGPWGERPLVDGLQEIAAWMEAHPDEVVTLILEAYIDEDETLQALVDAGLDRWLLHRPDPTAPWPTLGQLLDAGERLVVFTDDPDASADWHLRWQEVGWETPYDDPTLSCEPNRGDPQAPEPVFIVNQFVYCDLGGCVENAEVYNAYDLLVDRALDCWADAEANPQGHVPTFLVVDHHHVPGPEGHPDVAAAADALNDLVADGGG